MHSEHVDRCGLGVLRHHPADLGFCQGIVLGVDDNVPAFLVTTRPRDLGELDPLAGDLLHECLAAVGQRSVEGV